MNELLDDVLVQCVDFVSPFWIKLKCKVIMYGCIPATKAGDLAV